LIECLLLRAVQSQGYGWIRFSVLLVSGYAHVCIQLTVVTVSYPRFKNLATPPCIRWTVSGVADHERRRSVVIMCCSGSGQWIGFCPDSIDNFNCTGVAGWGLKMWGSGTVAELHHIGLTHRPNPNRLRSVTITTWSRTNTRA